VGARAASTGLRLWRVVAAVAIALVLWELAAMALAGTGDRTAATKLPQPHLVLNAFIQQAPILIEAAWATTRGALLGLAVGTALGFGLALLMAQARWIEEAGYPYVVAAQMIPTIALAPIILSAVRDADTTRVIVAAYVSMFSVSLGTIRGLKSTPPAALELMRTIDAGRWETYRKVRIPAALPQFFAGLKVAAPLAVVGEIVVELAGSKDGLGTLLLTTQYYGPSYAYLFWAAIITTMLLGFLFARGAGFLERIVAPWQPELRGR
jgi:NitT/TauT family transport system permease protein